MLHEVVPGVSSFERLPFVSDVADDGAKRFFVWGLMTPLCKAPTISLLSHRGLAFFEIEAARPGLGVSAWPSTLLWSS